MNRLSTVDLSDLRIPSESLLGQAVSLGARYDRLPEDYANGLRAYLQAAGMTYARRYRTGIGTDRAALSEGVRQALAALELGLADAASGDLDAAVQALEGGGLESLRKRGYEIAWRRLKQMREGSQALLERRELSLLGPAWRDLKRWATVTPDSWQVPPPEDEKTPRAVDPIADYARFELIEGQIAFLAGLPRPVLKALQASGGSVAFDEVLRRMVPPLALGQARLGKPKAAAEAFRAQCCDGGRVRPEVRAEVLRQFDRQLEATVTYDRVRREIREAFVHEMDDAAQEPPAEAAEEGARGDR